MYMPYQHGEKDIFKACGCTTESFLMISGMITEAALKDELKSKAVEFIEECAKEHPREIAIQTLLTVQKIDQTLGKAVDLSRSIRKELGDAPETATIAVHILTELVAIMVALYSCLISKDVDGNGNPMTQTLQ